MVEKDSVEKDKGLVKKIGWAYNDFPITGPADIQTIASCQKLEDEGFGMLEDKNHSGKIDSSESVVLPDGRVFTPRQIDDYWVKKKNGNVYSSANPEDVIMHKARMYYLRFKA